MYAMKHGIQIEKSSATSSISNILNHRIRYLPYRNLISDILELREIPKRGDRTIPEIGINSTFFHNQIFNNKQSPVWYYQRVHVTKL